MYMPVQQWYRADTVLHVKTSVDPGTLVLLKEAPPPPATGHLTATGTSAHATTAATMSSRSNAAESDATRGHTTVPMRTLMATVVMTVPARAAGVTTCHRPQSPVIACT